MNQKVFKFGYVPELDGIRGFAILAVLLYHANIPIFKGGFIGVDIFFVLSGFLITSLLIKEYDKDNHINLKNFYLRRVLRLIPALVLLLFVFSTLSLIFLNIKTAMSNVFESIIVLLYSANWARAFQFHAPGFLGHMWSLSIEEQFYILWPLTLRYLLRHIKSRRKIFIIVLSLIIVSWGVRVLLAESGASIERLYNGLDTRADSLLTGCALGLALSSNLIVPKIQNILSVILKFLTPFSALVLLSIVFLGNINSMLYYDWLLLVIEILTTILILNIFFSKNSLLRKIFSNKILVWIGSISYGLYLWHYPVFMTMFKYFDSDSATVLLLGSLISFIIAALSFYFWERPFLKLKNKLTSKRESSKTLKNGKIPLQSGT